jgi:DNA-binding IclR family transcriptional regulator
MGGELMPSAVSQRRNVSGLIRDLEVLEVLGSREAIDSVGLGVNRVAELSARDKGQISRTLATLADSGFVERDRESGKYSLGYQIYALAAKTSEANLVKQASKYLKQVVGLTHETAHLCVLRGGNVLTLKSELSPSAFRGVGWEGVSVAAAPTSSGRALLSDWSEPEVRRWYADHAGDTLVVRSENALPPGIAAMNSVDNPIPLIKSKVRNLEDLLNELTVVRRQGYALVDEEFEPGLVGASAPIRDATGLIVAVINVSAPKTRIGPHLRQVGEIVKQVSAAASAQLGYVE